MTNSQESTSESSICLTFVFSFFYLKISTSNNKCLYELDMTSDMTSDLSKSIFSFNKRGLHDTLECLYS